MPNNFFLGGGMYAQVEKFTSSVECNFVCTMCNFVRLMKRCHFISTLVLPQEIGQQYAAMQNLLFIDEKFCVQILPSPHTSFYYLVSTFFSFFFWRARVCWPLLCLCRTFCIFDRYLGFEPRELPQQADALPTYPSVFQFSHPSPNLAIHLPT